MTVFLPDITQWSQNAYITQGKPQGIGTRGGMPARELLPGEQEKVTVIGSKMYPRGEYAKIPRGELVKWRGQEARYPKAFWQPGGGAEELEFGLVTPAGGFTHVKRGKTTRQLEAEKQREEKEWQELRARARQMTKRPARIERI